MRLSIREKSQIVQCRKVASVSVNGVELKYCMAFDTDEGWVTAHKTDANGRPVVIGDELVEEILHGVVTVTMKGAA